jgi:hypothetical protein
MALELGKFGVAKNLIEYTTHSCKNKKRNLKKFLPIAFLIAKN